MCAITCQGARPWTQSPVTTFSCAALSRSAGSRFRALFMFHLMFLTTWTHLSDKDGVAGGARCARLRRQSHPRDRDAWPRYDLLQGPHRTGTDDHAILGIKRVRLHQIELHHQFLSVLELARTIPSSLLDCLDAARAPHLNGGRLPVGTLNFVKVHDADDLLALVLNFLVAVCYEPDDDHAAAGQEGFCCILLFHLVIWLHCATSGATAFAVGPTNDWSVDFPVPAGRTGGVAGLRLLTGEDCFTRPSWACTSSLSGYWDNAPCPGVPNY